MHWTLGFMITFVIGGVSGVLLAIPPVDYLMHNTTFLVAHFHNMLIPGSLFGFIAGYQYWFPKAFGFTLSERWGKTAFWFWLTGFYVAFMPLYVLGFMGMPRRLDHYDNPAWHPLLVIALAGTLLIMAGIGALVMQLIVSIRERAAHRDVTGDPWQGRTLEWMTSSPPPVYNFAVIPRVEDLDAFQDMKRRGSAYSLPPRYEDILLPHNTGGGVIIGAAAFVLGFAMTWHIWWLAALGLVAALAVAIVRAFDDDDEYIIPANSVERIENRRRVLLLQADSPDSGALLSDSQPGETRWP